MARLGKIGATVYHLIQKEDGLPPVITAELERLRTEGIQGRRPVLETMLPVFQAQTGDPVQGPAVRIYAGIVLDLLDRPDEAVQQHRLAAPERRVRDLARYHEAVAWLRRYEPAALNEAARVFAELAGTAASAGTLAAAPLRAFALAGLASVDAHRIIFWRSLPVPSDGGAADPGGRVRAARCLRRVRSRTALLSRVLELAGRSPRWTPEQRDQLECLICNARGNAHLNVATHVPDSTSVERPRVLRARDRRHLDRALQSFQRCEKLGYAGVETLTNMATTLLALERYADARRFCRRAIDVDPRYEYGYYRLAQAFEQEGRPAGVRTVLETMGFSPHIPKFRSLAERYALNTA